MALESRCEKHDRSYIVPDIVKSDPGFEDAPICPDCFKEWCTERGLGSWKTPIIPDRLRIVSGGLNVDTAFYNADTGEELEWFRVSKVEWSMDCGEGYARVVLHLSAVPANLLVRAENVEIRPDVPCGPLGPELPGPEALLPGPEDEDVRRFYPLTVHDEEDDDQARV